MRQNSGSRSKLRRRVVWVVLLLGTGFLAAALFRAEKEPVVNGRTVTEWALIKAGLKKLPTGPSAIPNLSQLQVDAAAALLQGGRAGAPALARLLEARESRWYGKFILWSRRQFWFPGYLLTAGEKRLAGLEGLASLGTNAAPALPQIATFVPTMNTREPYAHGWLLARLASKELADYHCSVAVFGYSSGWIYPWPSNNHSMFVCAAYQRGSFMPGKNIMVIGLRHTDGRLLDWIDILTSTKSASELAFSRVSQNGEDWFEVRNAGLGFPFHTQRTFGRTPLEIRSSRTNFNHKLETQEDVFRIRVVDDHFVFPPPPIPQ